MASGRTTHLSEDRSIREAHQAANHGGGEFPAICKNSTLVWEAVCLALCNPTTTTDTLLSSTLHSLTAEPKLVDHDAKHCQSFCMDYFNQWLLSSMAVEINMGSFMGHIRTTIRDRSCKACKPVVTNIPHRESKTLRYIALSTTNKPEHIPANSIRCQPQSVKGKRIRNFIVAYSFFVVHDLIR